MLTVKPEWLDYNSHMNVAYYVLAFDIATDAVYEQWQIGEAYVATGLSVFTLGMNVDYLGEMFDSDPLRITTQLVDADHKRIHYFHRMFHGTTGKLVATNECLCMNVELASRRGAPFPNDVHTGFERTLSTHAKLGVPALFGRKLTIRRSK
jgi:acyl-CoA thioesterase FadM